MISEKNLFLVVSVIFLAGLFTGIFLDTDTVISYPTDSFSEKQVLLPAVNNEGVGVAIPVEVEVKHGEGKVLADIDKLLFWVDTQQSIQIARKVASNITGVDTASFDLIYTIDINQTGIVGGPSAGSALTIATVAALLNQSVKPGVVMTGTINEDGTVGPVGSILDKAKAAKDIGAHTFIVPAGQRIEVKTTPIQTCKQVVGYVYCETRYEKENIDVGNAANITVIEVNTIGEALEYFFE